jgi:homoserine kinase
MAVKAYAPASIGNVSVGFDLLGAALSPVDGTPLGDFVTVEDAGEQFVLECTGVFASKLPSDYRQNIVYDAYVDFCDELRKRGGSPKNLKMTLEKCLPIGSGLGSSACSIVAALAALNEFHGRPFSENEIMLLMGREEGKISGSVHYDNVAPCYLGGIQLMVDECGIISREVPSFENWYWVSCYPGICVSTAEARKILPASYDRHTCIDFGRQLGVFIHASFSGEEKLAYTVLRDVLAEPYRRSLIPGFDQARENALSLGAVAMGISGSGPSIFAVTRELSAAESIEAWLKNNFIQNSNGFCHICKIDRRGTTVQTI